MAAATAAQHQESSASQQHRELILVKNRSCLESLLRVKESGTHQYKADSLPARLNRNVYGGQLCAQALLIAYKTVHSGFLAHSLHSNFIFAGKLNETIDYKVKIIKDAKRFALRHVYASQSGTVMFFASISFHAMAVGGPSHQKRIKQARIPPPSSVVNEQESLYQLSLDERLTRQTREKFLEISRKPTAVEIRRIDPAHIIYPTKQEPLLYQWMKSVGPLNVEPVVHHCLLAYASDSSMTSVALRPHGIGLGDPRIRVVSLDHSIWFHEDFRADEWMLFEMESPVTTNGRGLIHGHVYDKADEVQVVVLIFLSQYTRLQSMSNCSPLLKGLFALICGLLSSGTSNIGCTRSVGRLVQFGRQCSESLFSAGETHAANFGIRDFSNNDELNTVCPGYAP